MSSYNPAYISKLISDLDLSPRVKIIVGLDFGTTYSGLSWVFSNRTEIDDIEVFNQWPGGPGIEYKTPTVIAYASENRNYDISDDQWGYMVRGGMTSYLWTKLLLDRNASVQQNDDPALRDYFGSGLMTLPRSKTANDVCRDYLKHLYKHLINRLEKKTTTLQITPIEVWVTVPAIWSPAAKNATLEAAKSAGFGSRAHLGDSINVIAEPEAAALTILKPRMGVSDLDTNQKPKNILICDCGGGTVDITCYKVITVKSRPQFKELCEGTGAKCGSTMIDRRFDQLMQSRFGRAYTSVSKEYKGPGSKFMRSFEGAKRNFEGPGDPRPIEVWPIRLDGVPLSQQYDPQLLTVKLTSDDMQSLFDPVINEIIQLISKQEQMAWNDKREKIEHIYLVGGFGDSQYLNKRLKDWCSQRNIRLSCPPHCQAAIVTGAALRGLLGLKPESKVCRSHYGYVIGMKFREGIDPEEKAFYKEMDGSKWCNDRMQWVAKRKQEVDENTTCEYRIWTERYIQEGVAQISKLSFYSCTDREEAPEYTSNWAVRKIGTVITELYPEDFKHAEKKWISAKGKYCYKLDYKVVVDLNADKGILQFKTVAYGRECGHTTFKFEEEQDAID